MFLLFKNGTKSFKNNLFFLKLVPNNSSSRFCFSISKKVAKNAVTRNKLRRVGYKFLAGFVPEIKSKVLVIFSFRFIPKTQEEIFKNLEAILKDSKLIK